MFYLSFYQANLYAPIFLQGSTLCVLDKNANSEHIRSIFPICSEFGALLRFSEQLKTLPQTLQSRPCEDSHCKKGVTGIKNQAKPFYMSGTGLCVYPSTILSKFMGNIFFLLILLGLIEIICIYSIKILHLILSQLVHFRIRFLQRKSHFRYFDQVSLFHSVVLDKPCHVMYTVLLLHTF